MAELPTGTVTFLFTDMEGSTRLLQLLGERYPAVLSQHHLLLRSAFQQAGGHEIGAPGDGFFVAFAGAMQAVSAAAAAQRALYAHLWPEGAPVRVRMGMHTGEPALTAGGYVGLDVHRAQRIAASGHGGQVLLSQTTRDLVERELFEGLSLRDLGEHRLKDLARPERIYQLLHDELDADFPPLKTLDARPNNLPAQATPLLGREREVEAVRRLLLQETVRLVTLTGPGGTGKTRLGLRVGAELLDDFADGVFFVPLAPIRDPELVGSTIAQTLGVREAEGRPLLEALKADLREKQLLLALDNFEQILEAAPLIAELLAAAPRLKVLVTSRAVLRLQGEHDYPVPPLALPDPKHLPDLELLSHYAAVELFIQRAVAAKPDFQVTNGNAPAVAEICVRLDGLPLAIELAAARTRLLPPQALLGRLDRRLPLLTSGARDLPARQQTLRNTIAWSYDLLTEEEKRLFQRLAVFVGSCTLEAAEAVCGEELQISVLEGLASLVEQSLLKQEESAGGEARFFLLETIREFGLECLAASGEEEELRRRHALRFLEWARTGEGTRGDGLWSPLQWQAIAPDLDNLRAALAWSAEMGEAMMGLSAARALGAFWENRGHLAEGRLWLTNLLALPAAQPHTLMRASALWTVGFMANAQGDYVVAQRLFEECLAIWREVGEDAPWGAVPMQGLGRVLSGQGDYSKARAYLEEALEIYRNSKAPCEVSDTLHILAGVARLQGDYDRAAEIYEESLQGYRRLGIREHLAARELRNLGHVALFRGEGQQAKILFHESVTILKDGGLNSAIPGCLAGMAGVASSEQRPKQGAQLLGAAQALVEAMDAAWEPEERAEYDRHLTAVKAHLGEAAFEQGWAAGHAMSLDEAIAFALGETEGGG
jgi:predicted ATPase/class 3 adenylate cyclase